MIYILLYWGGGMQVFFAGAHKKPGLPAQQMSASIGSVLRFITILPLVGFMLLFSCRSTDAMNQDLFSAIARADKEAIQQALHYGASANAVQYGNETALGMLISQYKRSHEDRRKRIEDTATLLLERGADANALHHGFTPLQIATGQGSEIIVSRLLTYGADPNLETRAGYAPLWQTVFDNNYKIGLILLRGGADASTPGPKGLTPLQYLRKRGYQQTRLMIHLRQYGGK